MSDGRKKVGPTSKKDETVACLVSSKYCRV